MENHEENTAVRMASDFIIIFALVCMVSWLLKLLFRPFRGVGWYGYVIGCAAVPLLVFGVYLEIGSLATAKETIDIDFVTVKVPRANIRTTFEPGNNIVGQAEQGLRLQPAYFALGQPNWIVVHTQNKVYYMHKSTLDITEKKTTRRARRYDHLLGFVVIFYGLCAYRCHRERQRRWQAKLEYLGLSDRQLS